MFLKLWDAESLGCQGGCVLGTEEQKWLSSEQIRLIGWRAHHPCDRLEHFARRRAPVVVDVVGAFERCDRHSGLIYTEPLVDAVRLPWGRGLVFSYAVGILG